MTVEEYFEYCRSVLDCVRDKGDLSLLAETNAILQKLLAVCVASHFETTLCDKLRNHVRNTTIDNGAICNFVSNKAIDRQYHSWFDWDCVNANKFFGLFGNDFRAFMKKKVSDSGGLDSSIRSFLVIGRDRNVIVHSDFMNCSYDKTLDEIFNLYKEANEFVDLFPQIFYDFENN